MTYYPQPYPPPQPSPDELLAPARRAGVLMIVVGALSVGCGLCTAYHARNFDPGQAGASPEVQQQLQQQISLFETQTGMSFQNVLAAMGIIPLVIGAVVGAVGFYVRTGSFGWTVAATVITAGLLLITLGVLLVGLIQGAAAGPVFALAATCIYGAPATLLALLMGWLVQAIRAGSHVEAARQRYQAQLWQYQQYQQAYLQQAQQSQPPAGMGYHYPMPPALQQPAPGVPPPPPPPPAAEAAEPKEPPDGPAAQG